MIVLGIDPGLTGAVAAICSRRGLLVVADLPTTETGLASGRWQRMIEPAALAKLLADWASAYDFRGWGCRAVIERPVAMPSLPASTLASQFDTFGAVRATVANLDPAPLLVGPREWQKPFGLGADKPASRATAVRLYPAAPITRAKDHNRAEAILLAHYGLQELA